tara:strand:+ start:198 stop:512 length:315 start_codon:yes stop_codon:yes gene_type:complete
LQSSERKEKSYFLEIEDLNKSHTLAIEQHSHNIRSTNDALFNIEKEELQNQHIEVLKRMESEALEVMMVREEQEKMLLDVNTELHASQVRVCLFLYTDVAIFHI